MGVQRKKVFGHRLWCKEALHETMVIKLKDKED